jgi:hypothetical protein
LAKIKITKQFILEQCRHIKPVITALSVLPIFLMCSSDIILNELKRN